MRILFLTHRLPFPPDKGDKIRAYHFIRCLSKRHAVDVAALADDPADLDPKRHFALKTFVKRLEVVPRSRTIAKIAALVSLPKGIAASLPFFHSARLQRVVDTWLDVVKYDAVVAHSAPMAQYVPPRSGRVRVVDLCDVDSEKWEQYSKLARFPWSAIYAREARMMRAWERTLARTWDAVTLISAPEVALFRKHCSEGNVELVSNGVDSDYFVPGSAPRDPSTVLFMGAMDYLPNVEGVLWFHRKVWPLIRDKAPAARLLIVGPRPTEAVKALGGGDTRVLGYVDDVRVPLGRATLAVAPLHIARGVQNKVLEAMAAGVPVVATHAAFEGVMATPGRDLLVADSADAYADSVLRLLGDPALRELLSKSGRKAVVEAHSWDAHAQRLESLVQKGNASLRCAS